MSTSVELDEGEQLEERLSYVLPERFLWADGVLVDGRRWWQFWRPKWVYRCTVVVPKVPPLVEVLG